MDFISTLVCAAAAPAPVDEGWYVVDARAPVVARPGGDATGAFLAAGERVFVVESEVAGAGAYARLFRGGWVDAGRLGPPRGSWGGWCDQGALARLDDDPPEARVARGRGDAAAREDDGASAVGWFADGDGRAVFVAERATAAGSSSSTARGRRRRRAAGRAPEDGAIADAVRCVAPGERTGRRNRLHVRGLGGGVRQVRRRRSLGGVATPDRGRRRGPAHSSAPRPSMAPASVVVPPLGDDVEATMSEVLPSADPLDATDFDVVDYLNAQFPSERSIPRLDPFIKDVTLQIASLDDEISRAVHAQAEAGARAARDIADARAAMAELEGKSTITALKRMHMLTSAVDQLRLAAGDGRYGESATLLEAVGHLLEYFAPYGDVPRIADLNGEVAAIRASLETEVRGAFEKASLLSETSTLGDAGELDTIREACLVVDALGGAARDDQVKAFVDRQLAPYGDLFPRGGDASRLDDAERRFAWIRRVLRSLEQTYGASLPRHWQVERRLVLGFVAATREMFLEILSSGGEETRAVAVVLKALQKSLVFEKEAQARFDERGRALEKSNMDDMMAKVTAEEAVDRDGALPVLSSSTFFKLYGAFCECLRGYAARLSGLVEIEDAGKSPTAAKAETKGARLMREFRGARGSSPEPGAETDGAASGIIRDCEAACYALNTAEYCAETVGQLGDIVRGKIDALTDRRPGARRRRCSTTVVPLVRGLLGRLYFRNFCDKFVASFLPTFHDRVRGAKKISEMGTHQLLLDLHSVKPALLQLPNARKLPEDGGDDKAGGDDGGAPPPPAYVKFVTARLGDVERLLKLVGTPDDMLVERFKIMWPDGTADDLAAVMALKDVKKADRDHLMGTFGAAPGAEAAKREDAAAKAASIGFDVEQRKLLGEWRAVAIQVGSSRWAD
ncbi:hypothetical protein JL720_17130 [Aureococcus anophagefferens]|nr:hypothetical protein JL720_17130 [Aureococcus anophagefferens]